MLFNHIDHISLESFQQHAQGRRLVFLDPFSHHRTLFLRSFLEQTARGLLYHQVPRPNLLLTEWLPLLLADIQQVYPDFGTALAAAGGRATPDALGTALAHDLSAVCHQAGFLFIDDFDRVCRSADLDRFVAALIAALPDGVQIALSSALAYRQPWSTLIAERRAALLGYHEQRHELRFEAYDHPRSQLEVYALDGGQVLINGRSVSSWDGMLPRLLFFYLIDHPLVTRDQVFADFWPALNVDEATDIFHVTKHKISDVLNRVAGGGEHELTQYRQGYYMPSETIIRTYDVSDFESLLDRAMQTPNAHEAEVLFRRALDYCRQPFLVQLNAPWIVQRRAALLQRQGDALIGLGCIYQRQGHHAAALELLEPALTLRPEREDVHRRVIELHLYLGHVKAAWDAYDRLLTRVYAPLGLLPSPQTLELRTRLEAHPR